MGVLGYNNNDYVFELSSDKRETLILTEDVINWDNDDKSFERDPEGGGTLRKLNTKVEIVGEGANYIDGLIGVYGYDVKVRLTKRVKSRTKIGEDWESQTYYLDIMLGEFNESNGKRLFSVPFTQGGLYDKIKARLSDTYDLVNRKSADGKDISELSTIVENVTGREILRRSELSVEPEARREIIFDGGGRDSVRAVPFKVDVNSEVDSVVGVSPENTKVYYSDGGYSDGNVGSLIYYKANVGKKLKLTGKVKLRITDPNEGTLKLDLVRYTYNESTSTIEFKDKETLTSIDSNNYHSILEYDIDKEVLLDEGDSFTIVCYERVDFYLTGPKRVEWEYMENWLRIVNDDSYIPTVAKSLLPFEMFDRLIEKITGEKGLFISNLFGRQDLGYDSDGEWSTLALSSGFWARGFDLGEQLTDANGEIVPLKQFNTSLKDAYESFFTVIPLMWSIDIIDGKEYFRIEKYEYTQQAFTGVRLGRTVNGQFQYISASNAKRTFLTDNFFTKCEIGYEKGGSEYEEVFGLSAPHGKAEYNTSLTDSPANIYAKLSKFRADPEGYELARIKQARYYQDEDTNYDQDIFFRHLKKVGDTWVMRTWQDDFSNEPKYIYSPSTTGNLLLTPLGCALRHGRIIATGVFKNPYGNFTWISSNCNSDLELDGLKENASVLNKDLGVPFITGELMTFDGFVYPETVEQLEGRTFLNGEYIPNWYGIFEFELNNRLVRGKLIKSTINGNSKHEIALV